jgi:hypothetical protein
VSANERRPAGAPSEACWPPSSLPEPTAGTDDTWSRFYGLPSTEWVDGYERGYEHGTTHGRELADDEQRGRGAISGAIAAQMSRLGSFADLCEARGEPERAARSRQLLADRGI